MTDNDDAIPDLTGQPDGAPAGDIGGDATGEQEQFDGVDGITDEGSQGALTIDPKNFPEQYRDALTQLPPEAQAAVDDIRKNLLTGFHKTQAELRTKERELEAKRQFAELGEEWSQDPDVLELHARKLRGPQEDPAPDVNLYELDATEFTPAIKALIQSEAKKIAAETVKQELGSSDVIKAGRAERALEQHFAQMNGKVAPSVYRAAVLRVKAKALQSGKQLTDLPLDTLQDKVEDALEFEMLRNKYETAKPKAAGTRAPSPTGSNAVGTRTRKPWEDETGKKFRDPTRKEKWEHLGTSPAELAKKYPDIFKSA